MAHLHYFIATWYRLYSRHFSFKHTARFSSLFSGYRHTIVIVLQLRIHGVVIHPKTLRFIPFCHRPYKVTLISLKTIGYLPRFGSKYKSYFSSIISRRRGSSNHTATCSIHSTSVIFLFAFVSLNNSQAYKSLYFSVYSISLLLFFAYLTLITALHLTYACCQLL